jgi:pimeloyl-ACP methyl ester carboxylesterase
LSHQNWIGQVPIFARHYTVISYDCRGHGGTGPSDHPISVRDLSEDLHALYEHIGIQRAVLVGYSSGTLVAEQFALDHPDQVAGLCLIGSYARVRGVYMRMKTNVSKWMIQSQLKKLLAYSVASSNAENIVQRGFFYRLAKRVNPDEAMRFMEASERFLTAKEVSKIKSPVLLVHGSRDRATETYAQEFARQLPDTQIAVIEGCNHAVATRAISEFNVLLEEWLKTLELPASESLHLD